MEIKLEKCKEVIKAINEDDLDAYIRSLKAESVSLDTVTRARFKKRLVEISNELIKLEKLLNVAKPSSFDTKNWKEDVQNELKNANNIQQQRKVQDKKRLEEEEKAKQKIEEDRKRKKEAVEVATAADEIGRKNQVIEKSGEKTETIIKHDKRSIEKVYEENQDKFVEEDSTNVGVQQKKTRLSQAKQQHIDSNKTQEDAYYDYDTLYKTNNKDYAIWMPPEGKF
jgi:hypothetical protein